MLWFPIPKVQPGDTVWWHPDVIHAVEDHHQGSDYSNVMYIGAAPDCEKIALSCPNKPMPLYMGDPVPTLLQKTMKSILLEELN